MHDVRVYTLLKIMIFLMSTFVVVVKFCSTFRKKFARMLCSCLQKCATDGKSQRCLLLRFFSARDKVFNGCSCCYWRVSACSGACSRPHWMMSNCQLARRPIQREGGGYLIGNYFVQWIVHIIRNANFYTTARQNVTLYDTDWRLLV